MIMRKSNQCHLCKKSGRRYCPAENKPICAACCGSKRGNEINCPPECVNFPFGVNAYDSWLKVDAAWGTKTFKYVLRRIGSHEFEKTVHDMSPPWVAEPMEQINEIAPSALLYHLVVPNKQTGAPLGEEWKNDGWIGLNNDERFMSKYRILSAPGLLEIQKVLDDTRIECIDLLDSDRGKFIVFDRNTAARANRFDVLVVWLAHYPYYSRVDGTGVEMHRDFIEPFLKEMRKRAKADLKDNSDLGIKRYLTANYREAFELINQLGREMQERIVSSLDAYRCRAWYSIRSSQEDILSVINSKPDFEADDDRMPEPEDPEDSQYFSWMRIGEAKKIERFMPSVFQHKTPDDGVGSLGNIRLSAKELMLETFTRQKFDFAKKLVKKYFRKKLILIKENTSNLALNVLENSQGPEGVRRDTPPPDIPKDVKAKILKEFNQRHYRIFLDEPIPMLNNLTPRQAAANAGMRPELINLMKLHLHNTEEQSKKEGINLDINWVVEELGLQELM